MVAVAIFVIFGIIYKRKQFIQAISIKWLLSAVGSLVINFLLLFPLISKYNNSPAKIKAEGVDSYRPYTEVFVSIPTLKSYLFVRSDTMFWDWLNNVAFDLPAWWDHQLFVGGFIIISIGFLTVLALEKLLRGTPYKNKEHVIFALTGVVIFFLFIRGKEDSLYQYLYYLPGFDSLMAIQRIINIEVLFFSFAGVYVYSYLARTLKRKVVFFLAFCCVLIADNYVFSNGYPKVNKEQAQERLDLLQAEVSSLEKGEVFSYEPYSTTSAEAFYHIDAMLVAQQLGVKTLNGYTSTVPLGYYHYASSLNEEGRNTWVEKISLQEEVKVVKSALPEEVMDLIQQIKNQEDWFTKIKESAKEKNITIDQSLLENAFWVYNQNKLKKESE